MGASVGCGAQHKLLEPPVPKLQVSFHSTF
jgi:hypothetical protein